MKVKLPASILKYIILLISVLVVSCAEDIEDEEFSKSNPEVYYGKLSNKPLVTYILNPEDSLGAKSSEHIRKALNYAKIPFGKLNSTTFNQEPSVESSVKVIVLYDLSPLNKTAINYLIEFVVNGGHIFIPKLGVDKNFGYLAGVKKDANFQIDTLARGFLFKSDFLPGLKGKPFRNQNKHYGLEANNFRNDIEVLATSISNENYPLIIKNKIGNGSVISFNSDQYSGKRDRGLFFAAILQGLEGVPYPVANASSIMLDDFPAPLYNVRREPVASELDVNQAQFYSEVWWKDMLELAREEDVVYTAYVCFDYSNSTSPPFNFREWEQSSLPATRGNAADNLVIDLKNSKHELGFHGYNHSPFTYEMWPNKNLMDLSLKAVKKRWAAMGYGPIPVSYVPPSNIIDSIGFIALEENMPRIVYNASTYLGDFEEGGGREFDPEPYNDHFFNFPRITSGFVMTPGLEFDQQSLYLYTGIWTHFIHPDDIYEIPGDEPLKTAGEYNLRNINTYGWKISEDGSPGLLPRFRDYIKNIKKTYPLIRFLKVSEAAKITKNWREIPYEFIETENDIKVVTSIENNTNDQNFWFSYISASHSNQTENFLEDNQLKFTKTPFLDGFLFNIQTPEKQLSLPKFKDDYSSTLSSINKDYESYLLSESSEYVEDIDEEINELKSKIAQSTKFTHEDWTALFQYLGWKNRGNEIWPLLEKKYNQNNSRAYVNLSSEFISQSDYPNLETRRRWMLRQITLQPGNVKLRRDFIAYFGSGTKVQLGETEILNLIASTTSKDERYFLLLLLNEKHPEIAYNLVNNIEPCREDYKLATSAISWIFANAGEYKKAILWSECSEDIAQDDIDYWRVQTGDYKFLKERNYPLYIEYFIFDNDKRAARELLEVEPCRADLKHLAATIAYTYSGQGSYRKALEWSSCVKDFPVVERMQWYYSLGNFGEVERLYANYSEETNPKEKEIVQVFMAENYMWRGEVVKAWQIASDLPASQDKERLRLQLNKNVIYINSQEKRYLLKEYPTLFYLEVASKLKQNLRITEGDVIEIGSNIISDRLKPTSLGVEVNYVIRDKNLNQHQFGINSYKAYEIPFQTESENNIDQQLFGFAYSYKTRERIEKPNFNFGSRVEFNNKGKAYYHIKAAASISKDSLYSSFQFFRKPAITGPAYALNIYQTQLNIYEELRFKKRFQAVLYLEGNHYNDENVMDVQALTNVGMDFKVTKRAVLKPYTEFSGMLGNTNSPGGFPYWTLDKRFYGGLGASYQYENKKNFWKINLDAGYFLDTFSDEFQRYRGNMVWPISRYLHFNTQAEFYTLKNFYSNSFTFGLKYFLDGN